MRMQSPGSRRLLAAAVAICVTAICCREDAAPGDAGISDARDQADAALHDVPDADTDGPDDTLGDGRADDAPADIVPDTDVGPGPCPPPPPAPGEVRARVLACPADRITGDLAAGRVGDFVLENALARFVVRGVGEGHALLGLWGGGLVDATFHGGRDQLRELQPLISFNVLKAEQVQVTATGQDGEAVVSVSGVPVGHPILQAVIPGIDLDATVIHEYVLRPDEPWLRLRTRVSPASDHAIEFVPADLQMLGGRAVPFVPGTAGDLDVAISGPFLAAAGGGASYAYVAGPKLNGLEVGGSEILLADPIRASRQTEGVFERFFVVGDGSPSSVTDVAWALRSDATGPVVGVVRAAQEPVGADYQVRALDARGRRLTTFHTDSNGRIAGRLPTGPTTLRATCDGCADGQPITLEITAQGVEDVALDATVPSFLEVTVRRAIDIAPVPARVSIETLDHPGTMPRFVFTGPRTGTFPLAPGRYRVTLSRGPEHERHVEDVVVGVGETVSLNHVMPRVVQTPGAIAAEFHLHSESSVDSAVPVADRVAACAAEGLEFIVATDHDFVTDYGPALAELGLTPFVTAVPGCEVSSIHAGHFQSWPRPIDPDLAGNGAPRWFDLSPPALADRLREGAPDSIVQVNHPRFGADSTFDIIRFDPTDGRAHASPVSLGFPPDTDLNAMPYDAIEVFNGIGDEDLDEQLGDWYALLNLGHRITATAGGDSHDLASYPGNPRNMVLLGTDDPAEVTVDAVRSAVRAMRVLVTSGPYIEAGLLRPGDPTPSLPGDLVTDTTGELALHVSVQAPSWVDVRHVRIVRNGIADAPIPIPAPPEGEPPPVLRFQASIPIATETDAWYVVIARGDSRDRILANVLPFAITNPFFVDADGDGLFTPPGLAPAPAPAAR